GATPTAASIAAPCPGLPRRLLRSRQACLRDAIGSRLPRPENLACPFSAPVPHGGEPGRPFLQRWRDRLRLRDPNPCPPDPCRTWVFCSSCPWWRAAAFDWPCVTSFARSASLIP